MFINPIKDGYWTSKFGPRTHPVTGKKSTMHKGIDVARQPNSNVEVMASADGVVSRVGELGTYGIIVMVKHSINGKTFETNYAHLKSFKVKKGQKVKQGEVIGIMGNTGSSTAPHLHFEIHEGLWKTGQPNAVNPEKYIKFYSKKELSVMKEEIKALNNKIKELEATVNKLNTQPQQAVDKLAEWAKDSAKWAKDSGITDGTKPSQNITRQEVWVMLQRLFKLKK